LALVALVAQILMRVRQAVSIQAFQVQELQLLHLTAVRVEMDTINLQHLILVVQAVGVTET
jgi:hypothetical protein